MQFNLEIFVLLLSALLFKQQSTEAPGEEEALGSLLFVMFVGPLVVTVLFIGYELAVLPSMRQLRLIQARNPHLELSFFAYVSDPSTATGAVMKQQRSLSGTAPGFVSQLSDTSAMLDEQAKSLGLIPLLQRIRSEVWAVRTTPLRGFLVYESFEIGLGHFEG